MTVTETYCDRCHNQVIYPIKREIHLHNRKGEIDLCDVCYNELYSWFKMEDMPEDAVKVICSARKYEKEYVEMLDEAYQQGYCDAMNKKDGGKQIDYYREAQKKKARGIRSEKDN